MPDPSNVPSRKVVIGAAIGGLLTFSFWLVKLTTGVEVEATAGMGLQTFMVFVVQYLVPNSEV